MNSAASTPTAIPVTQLKGVGPKRAEKLAQLGISSVQELLFHLPFRYEDRTRVVPIGSLRAGDQVAIEGEVNHAEIRFGRRRSLLVHLGDGTGSLILRFFYFNAQQRNRLVKGARLRCFGEVRNGPASLEMVHPEYRDAGDSAESEQDDALTPVYPTTEGLHQLAWRDMTGQAIEWLRCQQLQLPDLIPEEIRTRLKLTDLVSAVSFLHRPPRDAPVDVLRDGEHPAQQRLAFDELLAHQLSLRIARHTHQQFSAPELSVCGDRRQGLLKHLGFKLTGAQERVVGEISQGLSSTVPMLRMVQGDVGSGKTAVAALAAVQAVESDHQVALMAPTELLAEQHYQSFCRWLEPLGIAVVLITGKQPAKQRKEGLSKLADGQVQVAIGTHALFQEQVNFASLGLAIIDEQHRFGVHQRLALREKGGGDGRIPHQLIMTATPIPRSLAMTAYADLDLSVIDELPPGRTPVKTILISDQRRPEVVERVRAACREGRQAYWVCTLIEESEALQCKAAEETANELVQALPELSIALVHGRMKPVEKARVMAHFKNGDADLLVATTVIEVGVDVPRASLMIIENPERLGLSQLHQLRGRVGRGSEQSHCVLMYHPPLGKQTSERLAIMRETNDGFVIAQKDLELRGPGEVLGTRQTGDMQFRVADLLRDQEILPTVQQCADWMIERSQSDVPMLVRRWMGDNTRFVQV
ncbi:MAG: ATP-dependent DNA helicase RecG [bacterium]